MPGTARADHAMAAAAREAYCAGWALTCAPMTEQVRAGCAVATAQALEHQDDPRILEVTLHLGKLQGTWAEVYRRREELTAARTVTILKTWRKIARRLGAREFVSRYRRDAALLSPRESEGPASWMKDEGRQAALGWLSQVYGDPAYEQLARDITAALIAAAAEGKTAALAVAADQASALGFDWATAYAEMYKGLAYLEELPGMADPWVQRIIGAAAADAGRVLAAGMISGASEADLLASVMDVIDGEDVQAVSLMTDYAIGGSMAQAALDLYASEGLGQVAWLTAGDGRVCAQCQDNEDNGPYAPGDFPDCPAHPRCRCTPAPASPLPVSAFADFLVPAG